MWAAWYDRGGMQADGFQVLLERVRRGDQDAAAELVRTYGPVLQRMIRVRLADPRLRRLHGDSDIFQSVMGSFFVRATLGQYEITGPEDLLRLLAVMVRNKVADKARRRDVAREGAPLDDVVAPSPEDSPSRVAALRELLERARARLPGDVLEIIALRDEGLGWEALGRRLGASPEALRKRLARAVEEVARELEGDEGAR